MHPIGGVFAVLAIVLGFLSLTLMWHEVSKLQNSIAEDQTAEGDSKMVRKIGNGFIAAVTNIGTGLYTNYLPTMLIRA